MEDGRKDSGGGGGGGCHSVRKSVRRQGRPPADGQKQPRHKPRSEDFDIELGRLTRVQAKLIRSSGKNAIYCISLHGINSK